MDSLIGKTVSVRLDGMRITGKLHTNKYVTYYIENPIAFVCFDTCNVIGFTYCNTFEEFSIWLEI